MHVRTPYLEAGSSDRGRGYAKWYLAWSHLSSYLERKLLQVEINPARGSRKRGFRKLLCSDVCIHLRPVHAQAAIPELFSSRFEVVIAPTHIMLTEPRLPNATIVTLVQETPNQRSITTSLISDVFR